MRQKVYSKTCAMPARLLALCCLLSVSASTGRSESIAPAAAEVDIYLKASPSGSTAVLNVMKSELAVLMQGTGVRVEWRVLKESQAETSFGFATVMELRGQCSVPWRDDWTQSVKNGEPLASTAVVDGYILPFTWVDCAALSRLIGPSITEEPSVLRDYLYGRALARLVAHELYHVLMQTTGHAQTGIANARLTAADLLAERLQFGFKLQMPKSSILLPAEPEPANEFDEPAAGK
jgi:hypothetical protein